ncbi:MAG TPA: response regulator transcription factor [Thermoanaerobaculia bacterium]|nr:response regulator transcription factor [Thermoanaerobaculia bacterium]HXT51727.1 response regulator transcription factor [Thermoanaerobaculia bacterium]
MRLVLADDHRLVLEALTLLLRAEGDLEVVATCVDGREALAAVRRHQPDVLVLDLRMPQLDGLGVLRELAAAGDPTQVVVLTAGLDERELVEAIRLGARGVVLKEMPSRLLLQCLRKVHAGEQWLEKRSVAAALETLMRRERGAAEMRGLLTPRELSILRLLAKGLRNGEIAEQLHIGEGTVKTHLHNVYRKLKVNGRLALMRVAREKGLA